jgi:hypothetical protein
VSGDSDDVVIREVTHSRPKGVVDQRIDWAAVLAGPFEANDVLPFPSSIQAPESVKSVPAS